MASNELGGLSGNVRGLKQQRMAGGGGGGGEPAVGRH